MTAPTKRYLHGEKIPRALYVGDPGGVVAVQRLILSVVVGAFRMAEASQSLDLVAPVETHTFDSLTIAVKQASAHIGIECRRFYAQESACLLCRQKLFAIH